jgi:hypothetical protein
MYYRNSGVAQLAGRGRPRKADTDRKKLVSIRLTPALHARLEEERKKTKPERPLSQEIEARLWQSLELEQEVEKRFHSRRNYFVAQLIADGIAAWIEPLTGQRVWENPYAFKEAKVFINALMGYLRPKGKIRVPPEPGIFRPAGLPAGTIGRWVARVTIAACQDSARRPGQATTGPVFRLIDQAAPNIVAQLVKSGKSALAEFPPDFTE